MSTTQRQIIELLAEGKPVWYVAAIVNITNHEVYLIGRSAGYPDRSKLRTAVWQRPEAA